MIKGMKIVLREKRLEDAANDYAWKTDAELARLDATIPLDMSYSEYLLIYADELRYANMGGHRFAIETLDGRHIGNCTYYNYDEYKGEAELGILIGDRAYWNKGYGADVVVTLINQIFEETNLKKIYLHTLDWNARAKRCFEKCGLVSCGYANRAGQTFIVMEIEKSSFQANAV